MNIDLILVWKQGINGLSLFSGKVYIFCRFDGNAAGPEFDRR